MVACFVLYFWCGRRTIGQYRPTICPGSPLCTTSKLIPFFIFEVMLRFKIDCIFRVCFGDDHLIILLLKWPFKPNRLVYVIRLLRFFKVAWLYLKNLFFSVFWLFQVFLWLNIFIYIHWTDKLLKGVKIWRGLRVILGVERLRLGIELLRLILKRLHWLLNIDVLWLLRRVFFRFFVTHNFLHF